ncbi:MAG: hypothetical protein ABIB79_03445 [archaeon]
MREKENNLREITFRKSMINPELDSRKCPSIRILRTHPSLGWDHKLLFINSKVMTKSDAISELLITLSPETAYHLMISLEKKLNEIGFLEND